MTATSLLTDAFATVLSLNTFSPKPGAHAVVAGHIATITAFVQGGGRHGERLLTVQRLLKAHAKRIELAEGGRESAEGRRAYGWAIAALQIELIRLLDDWGVPPQLEKVVFEYECASEGAVGGN